MRRSIFRRNLVLSGGMVLLSMIILGIAFSVISYSIVIRDKLRTLQSTATVVAELKLAVQETDGADAWELSLPTTAIGRATNTQIFLCDESGFIQSCSEGPLQCRHIGVQIPEGGLRELAAKGSYRAYTDLSGLYSEARYVSALPLVDASGDSAGSVFVSAAAGDVGKIWRGFAYTLLLAAGVVLLLALPLSVIYSRREAAPLREMGAAARQFAKGDLSVRIQAPGRKDEVGELAEAFNQMADALERSEKNRREFIANVSHELKTPMTTISGFADGLLDGTIPPEESQRYLAIISDETKRLSRLVRQMLEISRSQVQRPGETQVFDITETVRTAIISLDGRFREKQLSLEAELPEEGLRVRGNPDSLTQVVRNILDNAVKFADAGSRVDVRVFKQNGKAFVSVTDRGETIPEDELPEIFQRFHKSDRSRSIDREGMGLGLYIVKNILDAMGEDIWVRSKDGETEFRFSLSLE